MTTGIARSDGISMPSLDVAQPGHLTRVKPHRRAGTNLPLRVHCQQVKDMKRFLLADDNPDLRSALRLMLETRLKSPLIFEAADHAATDRSKHGATTGLPHPRLGIARLH